MLPLRKSLARLSPKGFLGQSLLALATALLLILSFPNFSFRFLAWVALAPLLLAIARGVTVRRAFWLGWLAGIVFTFFAENWIAHSMVYFGDMLTAIAYLIALFFAAILAIFPGLFAAALSLLVRKFGWPAIALAPIVWVALEWLRPVVTGVTWNALGISQAQYFPVAKLARFGGVYLVSAQVVTAAALIVLLLKIRERKVARAVAALLLVTALIFALAEKENENPAVSGATVNVLGVQPNLMPNSSDTEEAWRSNLEATIRLTRTALERARGKSPGIIVWSESPLALFYESDADLRQKLDNLARETGSYFILNTVAHEGEQYFNSISTISPHGDGSNSQAEGLKRYDKMVLVPFGEFVPWRSVLGRFVPAIVGDFTPGREAVVNTLKLQTARSSFSEDEASTPRSIERTTTFVRVGAFICYEAAYSEVIRKFVRNGATMLVNVSNDAWFGGTSGARQHLLHAVMRAVETDRDLVRVTNTGISALIKSDGRIVDQLPMFSAEAKLWQAETRHGQTFYVRHGDWFALGCLVLSLLAVAISVAGRSRGQ